MVFGDFQYFLADEPDTVETIFALIDSRYDGLYREVCSYAGVLVVNCGENLPAHHISAR